MGIIVVYQMKLLIEMFLEVNQLAQQFEMDLVLAIQDLLHCQ